MLRPDNSAIFAVFSINLAKSGSFDSPSCASWPDHVRLSDLEARFVCKVCGKTGADVRPDFHWNKPPVAAMGYRWDAIKIVMRGQGKGRLGGGVTTKAPQREPEPRHDP
jgi:hypothetical protein